MPADNTRDSWPHYIRMIGKILLLSQRHSSQASIAHDTLKTNMLYNARHSTTIYKKHHAIVRHAPRILR